MRLSRNRPSQRPVIPLGLILVQSSQPPSAAAAARFVLQLALYSSLTVIMSSAFRALSPSAYAPTIVVDNTSAQPSERLVARHSAIASTKTIDELVALVPPGWAEHLGPLLRDVGRCAASLMVKRKHHDDLRVHKSKGTFPASFPKKRPAFQVSKEVRETDVGQAAIQSMQSLVDSQRTQLLDEAIALAQIDVSAMEEQIDDKKVYNRLLEALNKAAVIVKERRKFVLTTTVTNPDGSTRTNFEFKTSPAFSAEHTSLAQDLLPLAMHARLLAESKARVAEEKDKKKKVVKQTADAMDVDTEEDAGPMKKLVDKAVERKMKKLEKLQVSNLPSSSQVTTEIFDLIVRESQVSVQRWQRPETADEREEEDEPPCTQGQTSREEVCQRTGFLLETERTEGWKGRIAGQREREGKREGEAVNTSLSPPLEYTLSRRDYMSLCNFNNKFCCCALGDDTSKTYIVGLKNELLCEKHFKWNRPSTYPDWFLELPLNQAAEHVILRTPIDILRAARYRKSLHLSTGVHMPLYLQKSLSVGLKYLLAPHPFMHHNLTWAYLSFCNRLRWRIKYLFEKGDIIEDDYDPDYEVEHDTQECPTKFAYIEFGLFKGERLVSDAISRYSKDLETLGRDFKSAPREHAARLALAPRFSSIKRFLTDNNYIITGTDKNLGMAVSQREWYNIQCKKLLSNPEAYRVIEVHEVNKILTKQCTRMNYLADIATRLKEVWPGGAQLPGFFRSNITETGARHKVPAFHGIPKIHKKPTGMRPIIPCHSAIQNPAAKFVSKILKPIISDTETILQSSRQFCKDLSNLSIHRDRKTWLITGDVVAFYPNIPLESALHITRHIAKGWYKGSRNIQEDHPLWDVFDHALFVGNEDLILQFDGNYYYQTKGLAMGVADSPDIANLYGAYFEIIQGQALNNPRVIYYKRYIDDIFAIITAESEQDALDFASNLINFVGCRITWDVSNTMCPFLDVLVFKDPSDPEHIHFTPYRKQHNHLERIPFISHHPIDVKRGTFLGEMSRLAALCSRYEYYQDAMHSLQGLYRARGYPTGLTSQWLRDNLSNKWEKRYESHALNVETEEKATFVVLKSEFNPVLNYFNAKELGDTIVSEWRSAMEMWSNDKIPECYTDNWNLGKIWYQEERELGDSLPDSVKTPKGLNEQSPFLPDVTKLNSLMRARWLVSRRRTRNLFDLTNMWKRIVLTSMNENLFDDINRYGPITTEETVSPFINESRVLGKRQAPAGEMPVAKKIRPRVELPISSARVSSGWSRTGVSDVVVGPSAPRGFITHWLSKNVKDQNPPNK